VRDDHSVHSLIDELSTLRAEMLREEDVLSEQISSVCEAHRESARNLVHYIVLRRHDIRDLQERLTANGLSSLGRAEADVLGAIDAVLWALHGIARQHDPVPIPTNSGEGAAIRGWELLDRNTEELLGPSPDGRNVRIMVTMPSEAATDFGLVRDLLLAGMNCMRVNCAHDGPEQWSAMIANLRKAMLESGKECRIHMDLGGPKLRTGPLQSGPSVLKYRPRWDAYGRVISPARIFLTPVRASRVSSAQADACIPVPASWLTKLRPGDRITFKDARGASRSMRVVEVDERNRWAESDYTSYLVPGIVLNAVYLPRVAAEHTES